MFFSCVCALAGLLLRLLSFESTWLRPALEAVFGQAIPRGHASDSVSIFRFLASRLTRSPEIAARHNVHTGTSELTSSQNVEYHKELAEHILLNFLTVVLLLDAAKASHAIEGNPRLFSTSSEVLTPHGTAPAQLFKATRDVVASFSGDFLANQGNVFAHLGSIGYTLGYKQTAIDEYDFTTKVRAPAAFVCVRRERSRRSSAQLPVLHQRRPGLTFLPSAVSGV